MAQLHILRDLAVIFAGSLLVVLVFYRFMLHALPGFIVAGILLGPNALGLVSTEQAHKLAAATAQFPRALWIVGLHHHVVEYPKLAASFPQRIGTALINGTWFVRQLHRLGGRIIAMHGHRHIDWIGECSGVRIASAPSPVMEATDDEPTSFHIHNLSAGPEGRIYLLPPETIEIPGHAGAPLPKFVIHRGNL